MPKERFLIAPFKSGLVKNLPVFMTPEDSFSKLENAFIEKGIIKKRFGSLYTGRGASSHKLAQLKSRLRINEGVHSTNLGDTDVSGDINGNTPGAIFRVGQQFQIGAEIFTVITAGVAQPMHTTGASTVYTYDTTNGAYVINGAAPSTAVYFYDTRISATIPGSIFKVGQLFSFDDHIFTVINTGSPADLLRSDGLAETATYDTGTGDYVIDVPADTADDLNTFLGSCDLFFYPAEPVMGLSLYENTEIQENISVAFDTQFAYKYLGTSWSRVGAQVYTGDNNNYYYTANFNGTNKDTTAIFATNFKKNLANSDLMYYSEDLVTWTSFIPSLILLPDPIDLITARILISFKSRLLAINTFERTTTAPATYTYKSYTNRIRFSAPTDAIAATSWLEGEQVGYAGGGYIDAPTEEEILSVQYIKNRLIIYCERSVYELVFTFNDSYPFVFQKLNSDLGTASTFATIPFDEGVLSLGTTAVSACNGVSVVRIDDKIPEDISKLLKQSQATGRICGIKDHLSQLVYWAIPNQLANDTDKYPDTILVYNYENGSWAKFDDCITAFGYFEQTAARTWEESYQTWESDTTAWNDGVSLSNYRQIIAGNQHGFIFKVDNRTNFNEGVLQITEVVNDNVKVLSHNLTEGSFVEFVDCGFAADKTIKKIFKVVDDDNIEVSELGLVYTGGGSISRVSKIDIISTAWNPYIVKGFGIDLHKIIFAVSKTQNGEITVNFNVGQSNIDFVGSSIGLDSALGTNILETSPYALVPFEDTQSVLWHSVYFQAKGDNIQIQLTWSDLQMVNKSVIDSNFELKAIVLETSQSGSMG